MSAQLGTVPARAAEWIGGVLRKAGMPPAGSLLRSMEDTDNSDLALRLLSVKQLKSVSSELSTRTILFRNNNLTSLMAQRLVYFPPKSGARKAEWVSAIAGFFQTQHAYANNDIYNILNGTTVTSPPALSAAAARRSSHARTSPKKAAAARKSPSKAHAAARKPSPAKATKKSPARKRPHPASTAASHRPKSVSAAMAADEALARSLHNKYMQEDLNAQNNLSMGINGYQSLGGSLGNGSYQPWGGPLANSHLTNHASSGAAAAAAAAATYSNANVTQPAAELKRPANENNINSTKPRHLPAKVKSEPLEHSYSATSQSTHSSAAASAAGSVSGDSMQPRDLRETNMVENLQQMGFTDTREILTALRAVAAERGEVAVVDMMGGADWSPEAQVEEAMMWIVRQREEADEARKLDEARISSELADRATEQSRRQAMEDELRNANLEDLLGSAEEDVEIKSKHFPCSVLLRNLSVKKVMTAVATGSYPDKDQVIRLLNLEKKSRKWYGTVLPFSYFEYVLCPRFEAWAIGLVTNASTVATLRLNIRDESDKLEKAMFNLAEQDEGGVGMVPKLFLAAQRDASEKGKPMSAPEDRVRADEDIEVIQLSSPSNAGGCAGASLKQPAPEVIDIT